MTREAELSAAVKAQAASLGFSLCGICAAKEPPGFVRFGEWLDAGFAGQMSYLEGRRAAYEHPRHVFENAESVIVLAMNYRTAEPRAPGAGQGRVSRYAWGEVDYHDLVRQRLQRFTDFLREAAPGAAARGVVDTAPLLERDFAQLAGLGWIGKNTMLINRREGSWFFLAAVLTDVPLAYDAPHETDHCGSCRACLDACPTDAFPRPYVLDATRCISYLTIELRESIPEPLREPMGEWVFGCDVCQDVCPWNGRAPLSSETAFAPADGLNPMDLCELFALDGAAFRERYRHGVFWRPRRRGMLRNAAIALGESRSAQGLRALMIGLSDDEPVVRGACAWSLGRYEESAARDALRKRLPVENDDSTRHEIERALARTEAH